MARKNMVRIWRDELKNGSFLAETILTVLIFCAVIRLCGFVTEIVDHRKGVLLSDPLLQLFAPIDLTWITFGVLWPSLIIGIGFLAREPRRLVMAFQAAALILTFRTITMMLVPLDPMPTIIPLADPIVVNLATGKLVIRDLFFSGHTSALFLVYLTASRAWLKPIFLLATITVATCVLLQHVHYSVDVFVAPFFAFTSWRIVRGIHDRIAAHTLIMDLGAPMEEA